MLNEKIGNYKILEKIGEGGMGAVFKGVDVMLEREVAIKSLRPELSRRPDIVERFRTEAIALGRLNHPHIATVYSFLLQGEQYFMVLEFVRGETLARAIGRRGSIPWREAVALACQMLEGLEHAHRLGIVHRDMKPANIMLTPSGEVKLMDFGIARILQRAHLTRAGHMVGTLEYMSPEHIRGEETDARTDVYSVGVILYEMLCGHVPFEKATDYELIKSQIEETPPPLQPLQLDIPKTLEEALMRALAKKPEERFPSAFAFRSTLEEMLRIGSEADASLLHRHAVPETRLIDGAGLNSILANKAAQVDHTEIQARHFAATGFYNGNLRPGGVPGLFSLHNYSGLILLIGLLLVSLVLVIYAYRSRTPPDTPMETTLVAPFEPPSQPPAVVAPAPSTPSPAESAPAERLEPPATAAPPATPEEEVKPAATAAKAKKPATARSETGKTKRKPRDTAQSKTKKPKGDFDWEDALDKLDKF